jgi:NAD(P)H dehydrogenase (quinone)
MTTIALTGSTGKLGGRIAHRLEAAGVHQRLIVRDAARVPRVSNADVAIADYSDAGSAGTALEGIATLLMVSAAETPHRIQQHRTFVQAAADAGVGHIVYISFFGASPTATFTLARDHWATEEYIRNSGITHTFLRDNVYADLLPYLVGEDEILRGPAGRGRVAAIAQDDIADVAALVLQHPHEHAGLTYDLTGPEAMTLDDVAATLTHVTGRPVRYESETVDEAYASRRQFSDSSWQVDAWVSTYTAIAAGELDGVTTHVADLTGHAATSLESLLHRQ